MFAAAGFTAYENTTVVPSLVASAHGKTLELGPGPGNQIHRFNPSKVEKIYAIDPNPYYADVIAAKVKKNDLEGKYKLLVCGIEDSEILQSEGVTEGSLDTVLSIQTLCAVKDARSVMKELWKLLRPGGSFVFWEHVKNKDTVMGLTQGKFTSQVVYQSNMRIACLNPPWSKFVGCNLNRDILADILAVGEWENPEDIEVSADPYDFLPRISGVLRKKA